MAIPRRIRHAAIKRVIGNIFISPTFKLSTETVAGIDAFLHV